jgi:hypothetical protein
MIRNKMVHRMYMHLVTKYTAVVEIWASAGIIFIYSQELTLRNSFMVTLKGHCRTLVHC